MHAKVCFTLIAFRLVHPIKMPSVLIARSAGCTGQTIFGGQNKTQEQDQEPEPACSLVGSHVQGGERECFFGVECVCVSVFGGKLIAHKIITQRT